MALEVCCIKVGASVNNALGIGGEAKLQLYIIPIN